MTVELTIISVMDRDLLVELLASRTSSMNHELVQHGSRVVAVVRDANNQTADEDVLSLA